MAQHVCPWWLAYTFDNPLRAFLHNPEQMFSSYVGEGMTVADLGCGMGYFSIGLARIVKTKGRVIAVDIQQKMLKILARRARKAKVLEIILARQCHENDIKINEPLDFALAFWMVHETPDQKEFFRQVRATLKPTGLFFMAEPKMHVSAVQFAQEIDMAREAGFKVMDNPCVRLSHAAVLNIR